MALACSDLVIETAAPGIWNRMPVSQKILLLNETPAAISAREPIWIEGGTFIMGSDKHYPEEAPAHPVKVDGFWIDVAPVTNRQFLTRNPGGLSDFRSAL